VRLSAFGGNALLAGMELAVGFLQVGDGQMQVTSSGRRSLDEGVTLAEPDNLMVVPEDLPPAPASRATAR